MRETEFSEQSKALKRQRKGNALPLSISGKNEDHNFVENCCVRSAERRENGMGIPMHGIEKRMSMCYTIWKQFVNFLHMLILTVKCR
jgi:hypothetical protein